MKEIQNFILRDVNGNTVLFDKAVPDSSVVLFLSEDFCPICVDSLMSSYSRVLSDILPVYIVFNNISVKELNFRSEIFDGALCFSTINADGTAEEFFQCSQLLLYIENMRVNQVLIPYSGLSTDAYYVFFEKLSNYEEI